MDTRELFARLIKCEAGGEGLSGMAAVATTVMNRARVTYGEYARVNQGDLRRVIEQECQFTCHKSVVGGVANKQNVWTQTPEDIHYQVADWAMNGGVHPGLSDRTLWFMNPYSNTCPNYFPYNGSGVVQNRINEHCFFEPTTLYQNT